MNRPDRTEYLKIVERMIRKGSGSDQRVLRESPAGYAVPDLECLIGQVPFVVVGGLATGLYMPQRMTIDTDILLLPENLSAAKKALDDAGYTKQGELTIGGSTWTAPGGRPLDLLSLDEPWAKDAVNSAVESPDGLPYVALRYLVLMKLHSGRLQDLADIGRMLGRADENDINATIDVVQRYRPQDVEDLQSIIRLGRMEYEQE